MTNVPVKLKDPIPDFKYFAEDQILTADDLNLVIDYLDRQQRMTRTYNLGVGIVCGLVPNRLSFDRIAVTKGAAITTDGDLLVLEQDRVYTHFLEYKDKDAKYAQFRKNGQIIPMWELFTEAGPGRASLSQFSAGNNPDFDDLVMLLYLESFIDPEEDCEGQDCDKRGNRQIRDLKVLLAKRVDIGSSTAATENAALALPMVKPVRVNLTKDKISNYRGASGLASKYVSAIDATRTKIRQALLSIGNSPFRAMMDVVLATQSPWETLLNQARFKPDNTTGRIQYVYAFFRDLANAYNDWRECACRLPVDCLPDPDQFPKHIVLGEPRPNAANFELTRHFFRKSALLQGGNVEMEKCFFLLRRIDVMIRAFQSSSITSIRLTPSKSHCHPLDTRAIPYYFNPQHKINPRNAWSFDASHLGMANLINAYHANEDPEAAPEAKKPFEFDIADFDFLRIEGHLGSKLDDVETRLESLSRSHNLPFKVVSVAVGDKIDGVKLPRWLRFPDLDAMFRLTKIDMLNSVHEASDFGVFAKARLEQVEAHANKADAKIHINSFNSAMENTIKNLPRTLADYTLVNSLKFSANLDKSYGHAEDFERLSADIFRPTKTSPIQNFLDPKRFRDFGLLSEMYDKRKEKMQEALLFANFLETHPGLEHLGGVPMGGTFILVYETDSKAVLADFCLPYDLSLDVDKLEPEELEEPTEPAEPPSFPPWPPAQPLPLPQPLPFPLPFPLPDPRPPIIFDPPLIFDPDPWWKKNDFKIDVFRGDAIKLEFDKTKAEVAQDFDSKFGDVKLDLESDIQKQFDESKTQLNNDFTLKLGQAQDFFKKEVDTKFETIKFQKPGDIGFDLGEITGGANLPVGPGMVDIIKDLNKTRNSMIKLQTKKALGVDLNLEEEAALSQGDARLANLVIEATKQPELSGATLSSTNRGIVETLRQVSLGIEGKANRNKLLRGFERIPANSTTSKELLKIRSVLERS